MSTQISTAAGMDPGGRWMARVGGVSAILLAVGYIVAMPIYGWVGDAPDAGVEAQLAYFADHTIGWWSIVVLMLATDLLYIPVFFGLHAALRHINQAMISMAVAFAAYLFVALDLAVTWTAYSTMVITGGDYGEATSAAQRAELAAAAAYPSVIMGSPLLATFAIVIPSVGVLLAGVVMLRGVFSRLTASLAIATGVTGILYLSSYLIEGMAVLRYVNAVLALVFYLLAGVRLIRLGRVQARAEAGVRRDDPSVEAWRPERSTAYD